MLTIGGTMILVFLLVEWRFARLPLMPRKFNISPGSLITINPLPDGSQFLSLSTIIDVAKLSC